MNNACLRLLRRKTMTEKQEDGRAGWITQIEHGRVDEHWLAVRHTSLMEARIMRSSRSPLENYSEVCLGGCQRCHSRNSSRSYNPFEIGYIGFINPSIWHTPQFPRNNRTVSVILFPMLRLLTHRRLNWMPSPSPLSSFSHQSSSHPQLIFWCPRLIITTPSHAGS